jgi:hypothetical protein
MLANGMVEERPTGSVDQHRRNGELTKRSKRAKARITGAVPQWLWNSAYSIISIAMTCR